MDDPVSKRYLDNHYSLDNPGWDADDSPWKAGHVASVLRKCNLRPKTICEIGCGAGGILRSLAEDYPEAELIGYDIAPDAESFWDDHRKSGINLHVGDFFSLNHKNYDLILLLDVLEHVADPHKFLVEIKSYTKYVIIHFPLDLSALSVLRETPLLHVRRKVGHIHYFTKGLALELLDECGWEIAYWQYTEASFSAPQRRFKTKIFGWLRKWIYMLHKDVGVRLLGGETLMVLIRPK